MNDTCSDAPDDRWWDRLAAWLGTPEGLRTARVLQRDGFFDPEIQESAPDPSLPDGPQPISLWQPQQVEGEVVFTRPDPLAMGDHFAARKTIAARKDPATRRICFFGESVAAGYLYAPHLTPAQVLDDQLRAVNGGGVYEVVDLARTNETLTALVATVDSAMQLEPDALVIFAGNNWTLLETPQVSPYVPSVRARQAYAGALREAGVLGPIERAARQVLYKAGAAMALIDEIARLASVPVVLVVPEVNLADWETRQPVVWLPGDGTARWYRHYEEALDRLEREEWEGAAASAQAMIALDGATCPSSMRLLAKAHQGAGDGEQAREACCAEVDSNQYATLCFLSAPQATMMAQGLQRRAARHHGFTLVDLPKIFAEYTGTSLPGHRLFLDYCHLTVEGMKVAMAAVTAEVLRLFDEDGPDWQTLARRLPDPPLTPEADATAKFGAAIHSAHRLVTVGSKASLLEYWCREALRASPGIEQAMVDFVAVRTARCPTVLTAAQQRNFASPYRLTFQHGWHYDYLDVDVIAAIAAALEGRPAHAEIQRMLLALSVPPEGTDLAYPPFYLWEPLEQFYPDVMAFEDLTQRATYRAPWPVTGFCLLSDATRAIDLTLTARLPTLEEPLRRDEAVPVTVNGQSAGVVGVGPRWKKETLRLDRRMLTAGVNKVSLHWPLPPVKGEAALEVAIARLNAGLEGDIHPVFGEIFSLIVRPADTRSG